VNREEEVPAGVSLPRSTAPGFLGFKKALLETGQVTGGEGRGALYEIPEPDEPEQSERP
jgi:hypothetical protein